MNQPRVALVTGASSGIGRCCADLLAANGFRVYAASRSAPFRMDVTDDVSVEDGVRRILEAESRIDAVVNCAGYGIAGAIEDTSVDEAKQQFEVNFFGAMRVCRAVLPIMRRQGSGCLVNVGSIGGLIAIPYQGLYSASKFALEGLTEALRLEVRPFGIRVVLVEPGDHRTGFTGNRRMTAMSGASVNRAVARMAADEQAGPPPERVARLVHRIVEMRNPRLRYTTGPAGQRAAVWLKRLLPYAAIERIMRSYYR